MVSFNVWPLSSSFELGICNEAPAAKVVRISQIDASNPIDAKAKMRDLLLTFNLEMVYEIRFGIPLCLIGTPLGIPVVPDVNNIYARSSNIKL